MRRILLSVLIFFCLSFAARADTIYLKDGTVIKGEITKDTDYSVQVMQNGFPRVYYKEQIDRIEKDKPEKEPTTGPVTPSDEIEAYRKAGEKEELTEEKRQLIFRLMEANGARDSMTLIFNQIIDQVPLEERDTYRQLFKVDEIISLLVPVYARYYTTADLKELISFYKSPLGQKHIHVTPTVMRESMVETVKYFQKKMPKEKKEPQEEKPSTRR